METISLLNTQFARLPAEIVDKIFANRYREQMDINIRQLPKRCVGCRKIQQHQMYDYSFRIFRYSPKIETNIFKAKNQYKTCLSCRFRYADQRMHDKLMDERYSQMSFFNYAKETADTREIINSYETALVRRVMLKP